MHMAQAVIEDWDQFIVFLSTQPLCRWSAQKQQEIASGLHGFDGHPSIHPPVTKKKADPELADALASMA
jgi:hypothetical protein